MPTAGPLSPGSWPPCERADFPVEAQTWSVRRHSGWFGVELVGATGSSLMKLHGIGPSGAAQLLVDVADITPVP